MKVKSVVPQLRTTNLEDSIRFYTETLGLELAFRYQDFYAGIRAGDQLLHLKLVDDPDPSIPVVRSDEHIHLSFEVSDVASLAGDLKRRGVRLTKDVSEPPWGTREFHLEDDQGHTLCIFEMR
jgi:catechol 2,3-dioxygenase-like lactoylglutathione lyase family enzyme